MIKIAFFADGHGTTRTPRNRKDDYFEAFKRKMHYFFTKCVDEQVDIVIHAGDLFDTAKENYELVSFISKEFAFWELWSGKPVYGVYGQHDMRNHAHLNNTPYDVLESSGLMKTLGEEPEVITISGTSVALYGAPFGKEVPAIQDSDSPRFNVLVVHDMLVDDKLWKDQEGHKYGLIYLSENKYDLIVAGDNHTPFQMQRRSKMLVMCGPVMRKGVDEANYQPKFYTYLFPNKVLDEHPFPIEQDVFMEEEVELGKERKVMVDKFARSLSDVHLSGVKFTDRAKAKAEELPDKVRKEVHNIIESVGE